MWFNGGLHQMQDIILVHILKTLSGVVPITEHNMKKIVKLSTFKQPTEYREVVNTDHF